jgi:hypothetical protein
MSVPFVMPLRHLDNIIAEQIFGHIEPPFECGGHIWYVRPDFSSDPVAAKIVLDHLRGLGRYIRIETLYGGREVHIGSGHFGCDSLEEAICRAAMDAISKA